MKSFIIFSSFIILFYNLNISFSQTCSDGIQNGSETGIDCGGTCPPCSTPCQVSLSYTLGGVPPAPVTYNMTSGSISTCFGDFYDSGGSAANYSNNQNITETFCSDTPGEQITVQFSTFTLESSYDYLRIYNGPNAGFPLIGSYTGSSSPGTVTSSNGCLTFVFTSDGSVVYAGWAATIFCGSPSSPTLECGGGAITLTASGQGASILALDNDFDFGNAGTGWTSNVNASFTNPCDPSIDGGTYMWMGNSAQHPRIIQTVALDLSCGGEICFWLDFATQGQPSPCEGIDLANEGVFLEYSINNGASWVTIEYFGPAGVGNYTSNGGTNAQMTAWNQYCYTIPAGAETPSTLIHWAQTGSSGLNNDHWGLDNVTISSVADCTPYWYDYAQVPGTNNNPIQPENPIYTTTYFVTYSNGSDSCSTSIQVVIPPCPCPDAIVSGGGTYCSGDNIPDVIFTIGGGNYPITLTYAINGVSQPPVMFSNDIYVLSNPIVGQYTILAVTDTSNCVGTFSGSADVIENPSPILISFGGGDTYCAGDIIDNIIVEASGSDPLSVSYSLNGNTQTPITGSSPFILGNSAGVYQLLLLSDAGCSTIITGSNSIIINPIPTASATTTTPVICEGTSIVLNGNTTTGTYSWTGPNSYTSSTEDPTIANGAVNQSGTYTLIISENGCDSPPSSVNVLVNPNPIVTSNPNQTICIGTAITLNGNGATSYSWDNGVVNGNPFTPSNTITYTVTGTTNGCTGTSTVTITVLPQPLANASASVYYGYLPLNVTYQNLSTNASTYTWDFNNGTIIPTTNTNSVSTIYPNIGTFYVTLVASNGICNDTWTDSIIVIPYPAIEIYVPNVFSPNSDGSNDLYFINVVNGVSFEATIVNRWGNVVHTMNELNQGWDGKINGSLATEGVYFIKYSVFGLDGSTNEGHTYFHLVR